MKYLNKYLNHHEISKYLNHHEISKYLNHHEIFKYLKSDIVANKCFIKWKESLCVKLTILHEILNNLIHALLLDCMLKILFI